MGAKIGWNFAPSRRQRWMCLRGSRRFLNCRLIAPLRLWPYAASKKRALFVFPSDPDLTIEKVGTSCAYAAVSSSLRLSPLFSDTTFSYKDQTDMLEREK